MADSAELAFVKAHLNTLSTLPIQYPNDYQQPPQNSLKKVPVLPIDLPQPPAPKPQAGTASADSIRVTFKSAKPPRTFTLDVSPADSIATLKASLATQQGAPPADAQRLLLRGKALADEKLLKEYAAKAGDVVNLMLKPGAHWDWSAAAQTAPTGVPMDVDSGAGPQKPRGHARIPSVVLSPSPSPSAIPSSKQAHPASIHLTLDTAIIPTASEHSAAAEAYHRRIAAPQFWERLYAFLQMEFGTREDAAHAFEDFLLGSKGALTPSEIAKIRDSVGVVGMGGM